MNIMNQVIVIQKISEIYFFELNNEENGIKNLQNASIQYKIGGKNQQSIKLYTDLLKCE